MKGTLIVIEAGDGSGKATQTRKLFDRLSKTSSRPVHKISFPDYQSKSSALIKMYLNGELGDNPNDVNPYAASTFYAADRYISFKTNWQSLYQNGDIIIADRYVTSNMAHQAVKIADPNARQTFLDWLDDLEYNKFQLPRPDLVVFLDMPPSIAEKLIADRQKIINHDIHEAARDYLRQCHRAYKALAERYGWATINCAVGDAPRGIDEIHGEIFAVVNKII